MQPDASVIFAAKKKQIFFFSGNFSKTPQIQLKAKNKKPTNPPKNPRINKNWHGVTIVLTLLSIILASQPGLTSSG